MENYGVLTVYAYTSMARLPVSGAEVVITRDLQPDAEVLSHQFTDRSGRIMPVRLDAPALYGSQEPERKDPFYTAAITIRHPGYETESVDGVQIFPNTVTVQNFRMIPVLPAEDHHLVINTPPQNL